MAAKKKTKNSKKTKKRSAKKSTTNKKKLQKKKSARKSTKKAVLKKTAPKRKTALRKNAPKKKVVATKKAARGRSVASSTPFLRDTRPSADEQSGDLQGLSHRESADSESVDELLEEGNAYEAEVVQGVEDAGDETEREVHTHEVSEDDVPEEYLDKD
jgi:hypothetical protein